MKFFSTLLLILISFSSFAAKEKHVQMAAQIYFAEHQEQLAITLKNDPGWHTYWKNPGDAGLPPKFKFTLDGKPYELTLGQWPTPNRYIEKGNILAYGYSDTYTFFFPLMAEHFNEFANKKMQIHGTWLVCKQICIPGENKFNLEFDDRGSIIKSESEFSVSDEELKLRIDSLPISMGSSIPEGFELYLTNLEEKNKLRLHYSYSKLNTDKMDFSKNLLTPMLASPLGFKQEKLFFDATNNTFYGYIDIDWDGEYVEPLFPLPTDGHFKEAIQINFLLQTNDGFVSAYVPIQDFTVETSTLTSFYQKLSPATGNDVTESSSSSSLLTYLLFAFLGGLILNLMPCVLPVISLKLFGLLHMREESPDRIFKHNIAYTIGVLLSFIALAISVWALKSSGEAIGWGFQLQSPGFVFMMMIIILIMSLNFFGLFEFKTPGGSTLGSKELPTSFAGDIGTGIVATILATPCSAPFLGTALTFAFTTSTFNIFLIFIFIGIGLAFPFIVTAFFPRFISFLPKPGAWMEKLKFLLGMALLLTLVWLYDVLQNIIDIETFGLYLNTILVLIFFAIFANQKITKNKLWQIVFILLPLLLTIQLVRQGGLKTHFDIVSNNKTSVNNGLVWEAWSVEKMRAHKGKNVFIDFTAKWCLTCKVNKKLVFETQAFKDFVQENDLVLMVADWTKRDPQITNFLATYQIFGVPAYFLQSKELDLTVLGQLVTIESLSKSLASKK